jgi:hypothetical protein
MVQQKPAMAIITEIMRGAVPARRPETIESLASPTWRSQTPIDPDQEPGRGRLGKCY